MALFHYGPFARPFDEFAKGPTLTAGVSRLDGGLRAPALGVHEPTALVGLQRLLGSTQIAPTSSAQTADRLHDSGEFPAVFSVASLDGTNGFIVAGEARNGLSGTSVSNAGDVNGDGFEDFIVGAPYANATAGTNAGAAYVVFGKASAFNNRLRLEDLDGVNGFKMAGDTHNGFAGCSVSSAGDVNGDGFDDVVVGGQGGLDAFVVFGKAGAFSATLELGTLDGNNGFKFSDPDAYASNAGIRVSAGDVNGDGFSDVIIGAPNYDLYYNYHGGAAYVLYGKASGFAAVTSIPDSVLYDNVDVSGFHGDQAGGSVSARGDINGDGFDDIVIGAANADFTGRTNVGETFVVFGKAPAFAFRTEIQDLDGNNGFEIQGQNAGDFSGTYVSLSGDINGDGYDDLVLSSPDADPHGNSSGAAYVVFGKASFSPRVRVETLHDNSGFKISGVAGYDNAGLSVSDGGDINGDGFADLIVGALKAGPTDTGAAYVVYGKASGFGSNLDLSSLDGNNGFTITGVQGNGFVGRAVSAGDINNDGFSDILVGATGVEGRAPSSGSTYVILGLAPSVAVTRTGTVASQTLAGGAFNDTLSGRDGEDRLYGNGGDDLLTGGNGANILFGGDGTDTANYNPGASSGVTANLATGSGGAGDALVSIENLTGTAFIDHLIGDAGQNSLRGLAGDDTLEGGSGNDRIDTGEGSGDIAYGGSGRDTFVYRSPSEGHDGILDFDARKDFFDLNIQVTGIDATVSTGQLSNATFEADLIAAIGTPQLGKHHAVVFTPDSGDFAGFTLIIVESNNQKGYQTGLDLVIGVPFAANIGDLSLANFHLM